MESDLEVEVKHKPDLFISSTNPICDGDQTQISVVDLHNVDGLFFEWSPANSLNIQYGTNVIASPDTTTIYTVQTLDPITDCISEQTVEVVVYEMPSSDMDIDGSIVFCQGEDVTLELPYEEGYEYLWNNGFEGNSILINQSGSYVCQIQIGRS